MKTRFSTADFQRRAAETLLSFVIFSIPLAVDFGNREHFNTLKETLLVLSVAATIFLNLLLGGSFGMSLPRRTAISLGLLIAWSTLSMAFGMNPVMGIRSLIMLLACSGLMAVSCRAFESGLKPADLRKSLEAGLWILVIYALFQAFGMDISYWRAYEGKLKVFSTLGNPNFLAGYLICAIPLLIPGVRAALSKAGPGRFRILLPCLAYLVLFFTRSYGAVGAHALALLIVLTAFSGRSWRLSSLLRAGGLALAILTLFLFLGRPAIDNGGVANHLNTKLRIRAFLWANSLNLITGAPIRGTGPGTFSLAYLLGQTQVLEKCIGRFDYQRAYVHGHCDFLESLVETGLPGGAAILLLAFCMAGNIRAGLKSEEDRSERIWALVALTGLLLHSLVSFPFRLPATCMLVSLILGYLLSRPPGSDVSVAHLNGSSSGLAFPLRIIPAVLIAGLALCELAFLVSEHRVSRAERLFASGTWTSRPSIVTKPLEQALRSWPSNARAMALRGRLEMYMGNFPQAREWLEQALAHGTDVKVLSDLGSVSFFMGDMDRAMVWFAFVARLNFRPELHKIYFNMGQIQLHAGNLLGALGYFGQAVHIKPDSKEILFAMGRVYAALGNHGRAVDYYRDLVATYPDFCQGYYNFAISLEALGDLSGAETQYSRCLARDPGFHLAALNLGVIHYRRGDLESAEALWNRALHSSTDPQIQEKCRNNLRAIGR